MFKYFFRGGIKDEINHGDFDDDDDDHERYLYLRFDKRSISILVDSKRFVEVVVALSVEVVSVARNGIHLSTGNGIYDIGRVSQGNGSNRAITLRFPAIPNAIGLSVWRCERH